MVLLQNIGGMLGLLTFILLGFLMVRYPKKFDQNFTAWFLAGVIDIFIYILSEKVDGNSALPLAYSVGSFIIAFILFFKKQIKFNWWDLIVLISVAICLVIWYTTKNSETTLIVSILASTISFVPQIIETRDNPEKTPTIVYLFFLISDTVSFVGGDSGGSNIFVKESLYSFLELALTIIILSLILYNAIKEKSFGKSKA